MISSVAKSTFAVDSSNIKILLFLRRALAKHKSYFYPIENIELELVISVSRHLLRLLT